MTHSGVQGKLYWCADTTEEREYIMTIQELIESLRRERATTTINEVRVVVITDNGYFGSRIDAVYVNDGQLTIEVAA